MTGPPSSATELEALDRQLRLLAESNPFYGRALRAAGLDSGVGSIEEFRAQMPFTTKADLVRDQADHPPYGSNLTFPLERYVRFCQTSSTTGRPLVWLDTEESWSWCVDNWTHVLDGAGITDEARVLFAFSFGPFLGFWLGFDAAARRGCLVVPGGALGSEARLEAIATHRISVLCATPTYAMHLGQMADPGVTDSIERVIVAGEPGGGLPAVRERLGELYPNARIFDHYGLSEVGPITYQRADDAPDLTRVVRGAYLCEIIDPTTGVPLPEDAATHEPGELVVTNLGRHGSPVLRYRTGDLVRRASTAADHGVLFEGGILGRVDDMVVIKGVNVFPSGIEQVVRQLDSVAEYQVEIDQRAALTELRVRLETTPDCADPDHIADELARRLHNTFTLRIPVERVPTGTLPRFELKAKRWIRI